MAHTTPYLIPARPDVRVLPRIRRPVEAGLAKSFPDLLDLAEWRKPCGRDARATLAVRGKLDKFATNWGSMKAFVRWREAMSVDGYRLERCPHGHWSLRKLSARAKR